MKNLLSISDTLRQSWKELQERFVSMFLLAGLIPLSMWLLNSILVGFDPLHLQPKTPSFLLQIIVSLLEIFIYLYITSALLVFIYRQASTISEALFLGFGKIFRLFLGFCIYIGILCWGLIFFLLLLTASYFVSIWLTLTLAIVGLLCGFMGLIILSVYFVFVPYTFVLTDTPLFECFGLSYRLVKNHFCNTIGLLLIISMISLVVSVVCYSLFGLLGLMVGILLPSSRYIFPIFTFLPAALITLIYNVPFLIVYKDRSEAILPEIQQSTSL